MSGSKWLAVIVSIEIFAISCSPLRPLAPDSTTSTKTASTGTSSTKTSSTKKPQDSQKITGISEWDEVLSPWLGTPYLYGGNTKKGTDCSGFVSSVYMEKEKMSIPRTTKDEFNIGKTINKNSLIVGDLVFFSKQGDTKSVNHVGIYVGNGNFIHASTSLGVTVTPLSDSYWQPLYLGARRY